MSAAREVGDYLAALPLDEEELREAIADAQKQIDVFEQDVLQLIHERDRALADLAQKQAAIVSMRAHIEWCKRTDDWSKRGAFRGVAAYMDKHLGTTP